MTELNRKSVLKLAEQVSLQGLGEDEGGVILRLDTGDLFTINDTAFAFVSALDGKQTIAHAAEAIAGEYDVGLDRLEQDLVEVAGELMSESLLIEV